MGIDSRTCSMILREPNHGSRSRPLQCALPSSGLPVRSGSQAGVHPRRVVRSDPAAPRSPPAAGCHWQQPPFKLQRMATLESVGEPRCPISTPRSAPHGRDQGSRFASPPLGHIEEAEKARDGSADSDLSDWARPHPAGGPPRAALQLVTFQVNTPQAEDLS